MQSLGLTLVLGSPDFKIVLKQSAGCFVSKNSGVKNIFGLLSPMTLNWMFCLVECGRSENEGERPTSAGALSERKIASEFLSHLVETWEVFPESPCVLHLWEQLQSEQLLLNCKS